MTAKKLFSNERSLKKSISVSGKSIELIAMDHIVFKDVYYIFVNGVMDHMQYGDNRLNLIFNEYVTEDWDLVYS
jgi:hypothetical protein